jgi:signal transduction histidine kinase
MQVSRHLANGTAGLAAALAAGAGIFTVIAGDAGDAAYLVAAVLLGATSVTLGLAVAARRPDNPVGALLAWVGVLPIWMAYGDMQTAAYAVRPDLVPVSATRYALSLGSWMFLYVPPALLALVFPDGRLPGRRWRPVAAGLIAVPVLFTVLVAVDPAPYPAPYRDLPHVFDAGPLNPVLLGAGLVLLPVLMGLLVATAVSMVVRYRRAADPVRRAQVKWFALGALFLPGALLLCWASYLFLDSSDLVVVGLGATYLALPVAAAIAVLRHDLYDVDRAFSTAVTYGIVTTALLAFYTVATFLAGVALGRTSVVAAAAATAVCAVALAPLRSRLQRWVDGRFYPQRQAALAAIEELRARTHAGAARPEQLESVLRAALRDPGLVVGYRLPGTAGLVDSAGRPLTVAGGTPVLLGGSEIGVLTGRGSRELLREVAAASALLVEVVRLRIELSGALHEVQSSRARLLSVSYAERRRLERDLHDGAQQRLVALGMRLRLGQRHLDDGTTDVAGLLDASVAELGTAVAELRQIAHGLRPASLDDGLHAALSGMTRSLPLTVRLHLDPDTLPDDLATTAYYVACEALTNAAKHAGAGEVAVRVAREEATVRIRVEDDGCGGATVRPGSGLAGLTDRVAAAGGGLTLTSPRGRGTVLEAVLPCG